MEEYHTCAGLVHGKRRASLTISSGPVLISLGIIIYLKIVVTYWPINELFIVTISFSKIAVVISVCTNALLYSILCYDILKWYSDAYLIPYEAYMISQEYLQGLE